MTDKKARIRSILSIVLSLTLIGFSIYDITMGRRLFVFYGALYIGIVVLELLHLIPNKYMQDKWNRDFIAGLVSLISTPILNIGPLILAILPLGKPDWISFIAYTSGTLCYLALYLYSCIDKSVGRGMANYYLFGALYAFDAAMSLLIFRYVGVFQAGPTWAVTFTNAALLLHITLLFSLSALVQGKCRKNLSIWPMVLLVFRTLSKAGVFLYFGIAFNLFMGGSYLYEAFTVDKAIFPVGVLFVGVAFLRLVTYFHTKHTEKDPESEAHRMHKQYKILLYNGIVMALLSSALLTTLTYLARTHEGDKEFNWFFFVTIGYGSYRLMMSIIDLVRSRNGTSPGKLALSHTGHVLTLIAVYIITLDTLRFFKNKDVYDYFALASLLIVFVLSMIILVQTFVRAIKGLRLTNQMIQEENQNKGE